jgi:peptidoglycan/xylan/chitin deacetylase (PgdA/CDA1 family)
MKWPGDAKVALSVVVNVEEGAEGSILDGDKGMEPVDELGIFVKGPLRNFGNESNYQYGIKAGFPRVSKLLDKYDIKATWTTCALALERAPQIAAYIRDRGHEACSHGWRWQAQHRMDEVQEREYIRKAVTSIKKTTGTRPYGWLSRYLHTENTRRLLAEEGFTYHMDDFSDDMPFWEEVAGKPFVIMPYAVDSNDMKFWTDPALTPDQWLKYATDTFDWLYQEGAAGEPKIMSLGLHLRVIGRPGRIGAFEAFLKHVRARQGVWVATRLEMAQSFAEQHPSGAA